LQSKAQWVVQAAVSDDLITNPVATTHSSRHWQVYSASATSALSMSSAPEEEIAKDVRGLDSKNSALMRNIIRKLVTYLERCGTIAYDAFMKQL
jgi:hypothetical protein